MLKKEHKQLSLYSILYDRIPKNHILKLINGVVNFSFINDLLEGSYCTYYGRPAKEPEMMARLLIIQYLYNLSDVQVIEHTRLNLAYMWFIGINPDEDLPDPSLLAKFRTQRLKETTLDDIIKEVVRQCIKNGIIKGSGISIDCTHIEANTIKKVPERVMKHLAKKILKELKEEMGEIPEAIDANIPDYKQIEDHKERKQTMKGYLDTLIDSVENTANISDSSGTVKAIEKAKRVLSDDKFLNQKGIRSLVDEDARVGYKSKTDSFYGYKAEIAMIPEERIITAVNTFDGAYVDGTEFESLYKRTKECGLEIKAAYGDKAYFRSGILKLLKSEVITAYIPVSASVYKIDESKFSYNKDSDQWFCSLGNHTAQKKQSKKKNRTSIYYYFEKDMCKGCPRKADCLTGKEKHKRIEVSANTADYFEHNQFTKSEEFKEGYKKRASHEWKNGELKRFHGLDRARGYGLKSISTQAKLTALAVNLKRIANLVSSF